MRYGESNLIDCLKIVRRKRLSICVWTVVCTLVVAGVSALLPKTYETVVDLRLGDVWGVSIEDPYRVASIINSEPFLESIVRSAPATGLAATGLPTTGLPTTGLPTTGAKLRRRVYAEAVLPDQRLMGQPPILVRLTARGRSPREAVALAEAVTAAVIAEHDPLFSGLVSEYKKFEQELERQMAEVAASMADASSWPAGHEAPGLAAAVFLHVQREQKQAQQLQLAKELRDARVNNASLARTHRTRILYPPVVPEFPVRPKTLLNALVAAVLGVVTGVLWALAAAVLEGEQRKSAAPGAPSVQVAAVAADG